MYFQMKEPIKKLKSRWYDICYRAAVNLSICFYMFINMVRVLTLPLLCILLLIHHHRSTDAENYQRKISPSKHVGNSVGAIDSLDWKIRNRSDEVIEKTQEFATNSSDGIKDLVNDVMRSDDLANLRKKQKHLQTYSDIKDKGLGSLVIGKMGQVNKTKKTTRKKAFQRKDLTFGEPASDPEKRHLVVHGGTSLNRIKHKFQDVKGNINRKRKKWTFHDPVGQIKSLKSKVDVRLRQISDTIQTLYEITSNKRIKDTSLEKTAGRSQPVLDEK